MRPMWGILVGQRRFISTKMPFLLDRMRFEAETARICEKHKSARLGTCCFSQKIVGDTLSCMGLKEQIIADLTAAMKAQDAGKRDTLRMVKAALMNRQIDAGQELTDEEVTKMLQTLVKQRRDSIEQYEAAGRAALAEKEAAEIAVIEVYLPQAASADEIAAAVEAAVADTGASSMKDMGNVMKAAMQLLAGKTVDGKAVSEAVRAKLNS